MKFYALATTHTPELVTLTVTLHQCYEASTLSHCTKNEVFHQGFGHIY